jgi:hypothetical protein
MYAPSLLLVERAATGTSKMSMALSPFAYRPCGAWTAMRRALLKAALAWAAYCLKMNHATILSKYSALDNSAQVMR